MVPRHQRKGLLIRHHRGGSQRSRSMLRYDFGGKKYTKCGLNKHISVLVNKLWVLTDLFLSNDIGTEPLGKTDKLWEQLFLALC